MVHRENGRQAGRDRQINIHDEQTQTHSLSSIERVCAVLNDDLSHLWAIRPGTEITGSVLTGPTAMALLGVGQKVFWELSVI